MVRPGTLVERVIVYSGQQLPGSRAHRSGRVQSAEIGCGSRPSLQRLSKPLTAREINYMLRVCAACNDLPKCTKPQGLNFSAWGSVNNQIS